MNRKSCIYFIDTELKDVVIDATEIVSFTKTKKAPIIWTVGLKNGQVFKTREDIIELLTEWEKGN